MFAIRHLFYDESSLTVIQSVVTRYHTSSTISQTISELYLSDSTCMDTLRIVVLGTVQGKNAAWHKADLPPPPRVHQIGSLKFTDFSFWFQCFIKKSTEIFISSHGSPKLRSINIKK